MPVTDDKVSVNTPKAIQQTPEAQLLEGFFLPDLCHARAILIVLIVTEALVLALTLVESGITNFSIMRFGLVSLFVQWITLLSAAVLCQFRVIMARSSTLLATLLAMLVIQLVTLLVSIITDALLPSFQQSLDWSWVLRNQLVSAIFSAMGLRYFYVQSQWRFKAQAELRSRLEALQANIRPHFFFNTLNTVSSLIMIDPEKAENMLLDLAQLFRAVLNSGSATSSLSEELALCRRYLDIEQTRLGERLHIEWQLPEQLPPIEIPQLLLQPLFENAIYHGIQPVVEPGDIQISVTQTDAHCLINISNSKNTDANHNRHKHSNHMALQNIRARLEGRFGNEAKLDMRDLGHRYQVHLSLPLNLPVGGKVTETSAGGN
ncbi:MAG: histidine kinase [Oleibacter sp.]|nr:histidine kinase [Thalassolituus sp.]